MAEPDSLNLDNTWGEVADFFAWNNDEDSQSSTNEPLSPAHINVFNDGVDSLDATLNSMTSFADLSMPSVDPYAVAPIYASPTTPEFGVNLMAPKVEVKQEPTRNVPKPKAPQTYATTLSDRRPKKRKRAQPASTLPDPTKVENLKKYEDPLIASDSVTFGEFETKLRNSRKISTAEDKLLKSIRRKINNRESARRSRANAKQKVSTLEREIEKLKEDTSIMKQRLRQLEGRNAALEGELNHHKSIVRNNPAIHHLFEGFAYAHALSKSEKIRAGAQSLLVFAVILCFGLTWAFQANPQVALRDRVQIPTVAEFNPSNGEGRVLGGVGGAKYHQASMNARRMYEEMGPEQMLTTQQLLRAHTLKIRQQKLKQQKATKLDASDASVVTQPLKPKIKNVTSFDSVNRQETGVESGNGQPAQSELPQHPEIKQEPLESQQLRTAEEVSEAHTTGVSAESTTTTTAPDTATTPEASDTGSSSDYVVGETVDVSPDDVAVPVVKIFSDAPEGMLRRVVQVPA